MRVAIAGAGIVGAFASRLLAQRGVHADVYGRADGTACGTSPCAWGTTRGFDAMIRRAGLDPARYLLRRFDHLFMQDVRLEADLMTVDKPALIADLLEGAAVSSEPLDPRGYDRIVDATGVARAYLPPVAADLTLECIQVRLRSPEPLDNRIRLGGIGYAWTFPLAEGLYHLGCGCLAADAAAMLESLGWTRGEARVLCRCKGRVRLTSPKAAQPFVAGNVWGVGEAIGCVAPLAGDGILAGLRSATILAEHWENERAYTAAILREFAWMARERRVLDRLRAGRRPGLGDAWVLRCNSRRMGMRIGVKEAGGLMAGLV